MSDTTTTTQSAVLTVTEAAREKVLAIRAQEADAESLGLRIEVTGVAGVEYSYELSFDPVADAADEELSHQGELAVIVPVDSVDQLRGSTLDVPSNPAQDGLVLRNPNRPNVFGGETEGAELSGTVEERIRQLLEQQVNPAIAGHGGMAELVRVDDTTAYIRMMGGCQGCAMSQVTLTQGIETAISQAVPEITKVVDATDHEAGENPFYE